MNSADANNAQKVCICVYVCETDLLHMTEDVLPTVKHSSSLLSVQLVDEVSGEVFIAVLIPKKKHTSHRGNRLAKGSVHQNYTKKKKSYSYRSSCKQVSL